MTLTMVIIPSEHIHMNDQNIFNYSINHQCEPSLPHVLSVGVYW